MKLNLSGGGNTPDPEFPGLNQSISRALADMLSGQRAEELEAKRENAVNVAVGLIKDLTVHLCGRGPVQFDRTPWLASVHPELSTVGITLRANTGILLTPEMSSEILRRYADAGFEPIATFNHYLYFTVVPRHKTEIQTREL